MKVKTSPLLRLRELFVLLFRISFKALQRSSRQSMSFYEWSLEKSRLNYKINRAVFKYVAAEIESGRLSDDGVLNHQIALETISRIFSCHLKQRVLVMRILAKNGIESRKWFVLLSFIFITTSEFRKLLVTNFRLGRRFDWNLEELQDKVSIAVGFPSHAFAINNKTSTYGKEFRHIYSSFGEYLHESKETEGKLAVISCGEFIRNSKKNEHENDEKMPRPYSMRRSEAWVVFKYRIFFSDLFASIDWVFKNRLSIQKSPVIFIEAYSQYLNSIKWRRLFDQLRHAGTCINAIYTTMFSADLGDIRFDKLYNNKIKTYSYSENILIPPTGIAGISNASTAMPMDYLREIPLQGFTLTGNSIGCTGAFELIIRAKQALLPYISNENSCVNTKFINTNPCVLGYEQFIEDLNSYDGVSVAVFDVPPESREVQMKRSLVGDKTCDFEFVSSYLDEICQAVKGSNARIIFKPKYSLSNYDLSYKKYIEKMESILSDRFIFVSPYVDLVDVLKNSDTCLSFPYTTTMTIADHFKIDSFYFIPSKFKSAFQSKGNDKKMIFGVEELANVLSSSIKLKN